jgi:hypothetical protein
MKSAATPDYISQLTFCYLPARRDEFVSGKLGIEWAAQYPRLFDGDDRRLYDSQCDMGHHFFEWAAAIMVYETTGYLSLIEKYWSVKHPKKLALWEKIAPVSLRDLPYESGWPDLFSYHPNHKDWFFCETKGKDKLNEAQHRCFRAIYAAFGKKIYTIQFKEYRRRRDP